MLTKRQRSARAGVNLERLYMDIKTNLSQDVLFMQTVVDGSVYPVCSQTYIKEVEHLNDIAGIRIICSFMSDIYPIADMIARQADITVLHVKDYIKYPKANGYKSYHMVVTIPVYLSEGKRDTKVEIQIRTIAMDFWASLEHKIAYKFEGKAPDYLERELKSCADMVDMLDMKMFSLNQAILAVEEEECRLKEEKQREREKIERKQEELAGNGPT